MEKSVERTQRTVIRVSLGFLIGIIFLIAAFWGGHDLYVRWQEKRLVARAMFDIEKGDARSASLAARTILEMKPSSAAAARIMAQLAEAVGERSALDWRRKVAQLEPQSVPDKLALVKSALQFSDISTAESAFATIDENDKTTATYHATCALLAQAKRQDEKADNEWSQALQLAPEDKSYQLQQATLRSRSSDATRRAAGEASLTALRADPKQRTFATRALISAAMMHQENPQNVLELAKELKGYPEATWSDRLLYLDLLHGLNDPQFSIYLSELEKDAATKPLRLAELLAWMGRNNLALIAVDFIKTVPPETVQKWPVPLALADAEVRLSDWHELELLTEKAQWGQFEFLRHAYLTNALRKQNKAAAAEREWAAALKGASEQPESLLLLAQTLSEWGWEMETSDVLWALSKHPQKQKEALLALYQYYAKATDTQGLYRVLVRLSEMDMGNLNVENNLAQVSLLLNVNPEEARRLAADVYHKSPANPAYITTYAYSLLSQGNIKEAVRIMSSLNEGQLAEPTISVYYGICLAASGDQKARAYLDFGKGANLLPEEKALVEKAYGNLESRSRKG